MTLRYLPCVISKTTRGLTNCVLSNLSRVVLVMFLKPLDQMHGSAAAGEHEILNLMTWLNWHVLLGNTNSTSLMFGGSEMCTLRDFKNVVFAGAMSFRLATCVFNNSSA